VEALFNKLYERISLEDRQKEIVKKVEFSHSDNAPRYIVEYDEIKIEGTLRKVLEDVATAYLVVQLVKKYGYPKESIILEKRRPTGRTATYFDVFIEKPEKYGETGRNVCALFEVKVGQISEREDIKYIWNQLIEPALSLSGNSDYPYPKFLIYYRVWVEQNEFREKIKVIDFEELILKEKEISKKKLKDILSDPMITTERIPHYQEPWTSSYINLLRKGSKYDLRPFVDLQEITKVISEVKDLIWRGGKVKTERAFKFIIRFLLTKLWDEESTEEGQEYSLQIKPQDKNKEGIDDGFVNRINEKYREALHNLIGIPPEQAMRDDILTIEYEREGRPIKIDKEILFEIVRRVQNYRFRADRSNVDLLGEFFERFLWDEYKQEKGQFFTHPNLVRFIVEMLQLPQKFVEKVRKREYPYILDPACGSGTFLVEAMKSIDRLIHSGEEYKDVREGLEKIKGKEKHWAYKFLYGIDVERDLVLTAKVNMIMHGDGSGSIFEADALDDLENLHKLYFQYKLGGEVTTLSDFKQQITKKLYEKFQFIITNPPFSLPLGEIDAEKLQRNFYLAGIFERQTKGRSKNSEIFFIERWYQLLKEGGEIGVVLPEAVFDTLEYLPLRLFILFRFKIKALVSLPEHAFAPFTTQRTTLLFAEKRKKDETLKLDRYFNNILSCLDLNDEKFLSSINQIKSVDEPIRHKILEIKNEDTLSREARAYKILLEILPEEKYKFFIALVENIGYFRTKKAYWEIEKNDLKVVLDDYYSWLNSGNTDFSFPYSKVVSTELIGDSDDLRFDVKFLLRNIEGISLTDIFDIVEGIRVFTKDNEENEDNFSKWLYNLNEDTIKYVETGHVTAKGDINYVEIPKQDLLSFNEYGFDEYEGDRNEERETTITNYFRILKKIKDGKIIQLPAGCIIIAPARVYQSKIALIDEFFANNFYFSPDFIVLEPKEDNPYVEDIIEAFLLLKSKCVVNQLDKVSRIGKGGYPKLRKEDLKYVKIPYHCYASIKEKSKKEAVKSLIKKRKELFELIQQIRFD